MPVTRDSLRESLDLLHVMTGGNLTSQQDHAASVGYAFILEICRHGASVYSPDRFSDTNIGELSWEAAFLLLTSDTSTTLSRICLHKGNGTWGILDSGAESYWFKLLDTRGTLNYMDPSFEVDAKHYSGSAARAKAI